MKYLLVSLLLFFNGFILIAQEKQMASEGSKTPMLDTISEKNTKTKEIVPDYTSVNPPPVILNDSTEIILKDYARSTTIDSLWKTKLLASDLYPKMQRLVHDTVSLNPINRELPTDTLKARLAKINAKTPFRVEYNTSLESVINYYLKRDRKIMEKIMALSTYYFPMFEEKLDKYNIPLEIKYLAIVESALNPRAKSRVGATGLWQFMFSTGKMHGLDVSSYVDERMDPIRSTEAACKYLSSLYSIFGDWDLALASYNSGPGNVSKAIRRSGGKKDYWKLRRFLPRETAGYVPAFLASMYVFEYAEEHGFAPQPPQTPYFETDTIHTKQLLKFEQITKATGIDKEFLAFLNPEYKLGIVPYIEDETYYIRLPLTEAGLFVANEKLIYQYAEEEITQQETPLPKYYEADDKIRYRVRSGDYLGKIAERYGVGVSKIKQWNRLRTNNLRIGQYLTIYPRKPIHVEQSQQISSAKAKTTSVAEEYYTVKRGDSLWSISRKFPGVSIQNIQKWNDISGNKLKPGMKLKISKG